jgi:hypothetical protein
MPTTAQRAFRSQVPEKLVRTLPKTCDGFRAALGMTVFYAHSLDSFRGPHAVVITKMSETHCYFKTEEDRREVEIGVSWNDIYYGESNAKMRTRHRNPT